MTADHPGPAVALPAPHIYALRHLGENAYQSVNSDGRRCLIFLVNRADQIAMQLEGVLLEYKPACELSDQGNAFVSAAVLVHCRHVQHEPRFDAVIHDVKQSIHKSPELFRRQESVTDFVQDYASLFGPLPRLQDREQRGLWGELYMIVRSDSVETAVRAWHGPEHGLIDFSANNQEVEVKTAIGRHRHRVKHEQVTKPPPTVGDRVLWSLQIQEDDRGQSLSDLVQSIRSRLLVRKVFESKLHSASYADDPSYDAKYKVVSEKVVDYTVMPALPPLPKEITHLEYDLDMEKLRGIDHGKAMALWSRLTVQAPGG